VLVVVHVTRPKRSEYDESYSDPHLPFSIFLGIDGAEQANGDLRLAEGILHECMHLQLTLMEEIVPMVSNGNERHYSPWQATMRPSQGILHGLYVFRVIQDFHRALLENGSLTPREQSYLTRRIDSIEEEIAAVGDLAASRDLTETGRWLAAALQAA
jgi:HEXXH motif-containing protein